MTPDPNCPICRGRGSFTERHGPGLREELDCECVEADPAPPRLAAFREAVARGDYATRPTTNGLDLNA